MARSSATGEGSPRRASFGVHALSADTSSAKARSWLKLEKPETGEIVVSVVRGNGSAESSKQRVGRKERSVLIS